MEKPGQAAVRLKSIEAMDVNGWRNDEARKKILAGRLRGTAAGVSGRREPDFSEETRRGEVYGGTGRS